MPQTLPKLKIKGLNWDAHGEYWDFEQARYLPFGENVVVVAEDKVVASYEDILAMTEMDRYRNLPVFRITLFPLMVGG
jgi:hypothetical protein